ncbi:MAG: DUF4968 domain-containing protein, partial [Balneolaceae bacterium]|nr:DUF4968 domain-containing protein [Balneolaceae bacterium]
MAEENLEEHLVSDETPRYPDVIKRFRPDRLNSVEQEDHTVICRSKNGITLEITPVTADIFNLKYRTEADLQQEFSYAVDPGFNPSSVDFTVEKEAEYVEIRSRSLRCRIAREGMLVSFYNADGELICEDNRGY